MRYLYGDSTPFPLAENFLATLCAATDACVALLRADERAADGRRAVREAELRATQELTRIDGLARRADEAFAAAPTGPSTPTDAAAARIREMARAAVDDARTEVLRWRAIAVAEAANAPTQAAVLPALASFLTRHQLPETAWSLRWIAAGTSSQVELYARAPLGIEATFDAALPEDHLWARPVPVRLVDCDAVLVVVQKPWLGKPRPAPLRLEPLFVSALTHVPDRAAMTLSTSPRGPSAGLELVLRDPGGNPPTATLLGRDGRPAGAPQPLSPADAATAQRLWARLEGTACDMVCHRKRLAAASLRGVPVAEIVHPEVLAEVLIESLAPHVREVARRTATPGELSLKRTLGDGRREELFVAYEQALAGVEQLSERHRALFDAYALGRRYEPPRIVPPVPRAAAVRRMPPPVPQSPPQLRVLRGGAAPA